MNNDKKRQIEKSLKAAKWFLLIGVPLALLTPLLFTQKWGWADFSSTGSIGDTIGGITAPFMNLIGAILVYLALRAQVDANLMVQDQIDDQKEQSKNERESENLNKLYRTFKTGVDNFEYSTLKKSDFGKEMPVKGAEAFYNLFQSIFCTSHFSPTELEMNPKITEVKSLLLIAKNILFKLESSSAPDKDILKEMTEHQFKYIICPRISMKSDDEIRRYKCNRCKSDHGLPDELANIIIEIRSKMNTP